MTTLKTVLDEVEKERKLRAIDGTTLDSLPDVPVLIDPEDIDKALDEWYPEGQRETMYWEIIRECLRRADEETIVKPENGHCGNCGHKLYKTYNYCPVCGRTIWWRGEKHD